MSSRMPRGLFCPKPPTTSPLRWARRGSYPAGCTITARRKRTAQEPGRPSLLLDCPASLSSRHLARRETLAVGSGRSLEWLVQVERPLLPAVGRRGTLPVLRHARKRPADHGVPPRSRPALVSPPAAPEPAAPHAVGTDATLHRPLASARENLPPRSLETPARHHPRQGPRSVVPHAGICGGGHERSRFLLRLVRIWRGPGVGNCPGRLDIILARCCRHHVLGRGDRLFPPCGVASISPPRSVTGIRARSRSRQTSPRLHTIARTHPRPATSSARDDNSTSTGNVRSGWSCEIRR